MAFDKSRVMVPGHGTVMFAPANTDPVDPAKFNYLDPSTYPGWVVGYTSKKSLPQLSKDGGELKTLDAWEEDALASSTSATTFTLKLSKIQIDRPNLEMALPGGTWNAAAGTYDVGAIGSIFRAVQIIAFDGAGMVMSIYMGNVQLTLGDMPEFDVENFFALGVSGNVLTDANGRRFRFFPVEHVAPTTPPTITGVSPLSATSGSIVTITGSGFTGTTGVTVGGTTASTVTVISDTQLTAVMPTGTAGPGDIVVTNAIGPSTAFSYTRGA